MNPTNRKKFPAGAPGRICLVTESYWPATGGVEAWVHAHSAHLGKKFPVSIVAHTISAIPSGLFSRTVLLKGFSPFLDDFGNRVSSLSPSIFGRIVMLPCFIWNLPLIKRFWPKPVFDFLYFFYKAAFLRRLSRECAHADIVHCFSTGYLAVCVSDMCTRRGIRLIHSPPVHFGKWGDSPLLMSSYARADAVLCLSQVFKTEFMNRVPASAGIVSAIPALTIETETQRIPAGAPHSRFALFLGRREKHKGLDLLLSAFVRCRAPAALVVAGPGSRLSQAPEFCIDLGKVDDEEKEWLLENCAVFCVPTSDESFGIVFVEAMRHARPVIALDIAPVNEIVINGQTGICVPPGDENGLARALTRLLCEEAHGKKMGEEGRKRYVEFFSPDIIAKRTAAVYESLL